MATVDTIESYYQAYLQRPADSAGLDSWVHAVDSGLVSLEQAREAFLLSPEAQDIVIPLVLLYQAAYNRVPDQEGLRDWADQLRHGKTLADVAEVAVSNAESQAIYGSSTGLDVGFITALYVNVLGRVPESAQVIRDWMNSGLSRADMLLAFATCEELHGRAEGPVALFLARAAEGTESYEGNLFDAEHNPEEYGETYTLTSSMESVDEGSTVYIQLATTGVKAGAELAYKISGIQAEDLDGGSLTGVLKVDASGHAVVALKLKADALTEGAETLKLQLLNGGSEIEVAVNDTSESPPPVGKTINLTPSVDNVVGTDYADTINAVISTTAGLTTLTGLDQIDGGDGDDTLNISDDNTGAGATAMPAGSGVKNVEVLNVTSNRDVGTTSARFDSSKFTGLQVETVTGKAVYLKAADDVALTVNSTGDADIVGGKAVTVIAGGAATLAVSKTTDVAVNSDAGVTITGGHDAVVNAADTVSINGVTGSVVVNESATTGTASVTVRGGTDITINAAGGTVANGAFTSKATAVNVGVDAAVKTDAKTGTQTISNLSSISTGSVVINNSREFTDEDGNVQTGFGTGAVKVYTNGAASVMVTGGGGTGSVIKDVQTTELVPATGKAAVAGVSTLQNVSLNGFSGAISITSDALKDLSITNSQAGGDYGQTAVTQVTIDNDKDHTLALTLGNTATGTSVTDATATGINVTAGGKPSEVALSAAKATSLTFSNSADVKLGSRTLGELTKIVGSGQGKLDLDDVGSLAKLTSIDASGASGAVTAGIDASKQSFKGGSGDDVVTISSAVGTGLSVDGGAGIDTLSTTVANAVTISASSSNSISNFEKLLLSDKAAAPSTVNLANLGNISYVQSAGTAPAGTAEVSTVTFAGLLAGQSFTVAGRTVTANGGNLSANDVASAFGGGTVANASVSGTLTGWTAAAASANQVAFTSTTIGNVADLTTSGNGVAPPIAPTVVTLTPGAIDTDPDPLIDNGVQEVQEVTFTNLLAGQSVTVAGLTLTATGNVSAAAVEAAFVAGISGGGVTVSGTLAGFTAVLGAPSDGKVTLTSTIKADVAPAAGASAGTPAPAALAAPAKVDGTTGASLTLNNFASGGTLELTDTVLGDMTVAVRGATSSAADVLNVKLNGTAALANTGHLIVANVETINIATAHSGSTAPAVASTLELDAADATSLKVSGDHGVNFTGSVLGKVVSLDASGVIAGGANAAAIGTAGAVTFSTAVTDKNVTLLGGNGADNLNASSVTDTTKSATIDGGAGNDSITGGAGDDVLKGGEGNDTISGGAGKNTIDGGAGDDTITVGNGANGITAGEGNDTVTLGNGNNTVDLGAGDDHVFLGTGLNSVTLGEGKDWVTVNTTPNANTYSTIFGFGAGDKLDFAGVHGTETFTKDAVTLASTAVFQDFLNAAAVGDGSPNGKIAWFQFGGDTYVVEDNSDGSSFVNGADAVVKLSGLVDFSKYDVASHTLIA